MQKVSLRVMAIDIPPQDVITRDNISIKVNAGAVHAREDSGQGGRRRRELPVRHGQLAQTTLRSVLGETEMDQLLADREKINAILRQIIDTRCEEWGIEVSAVEVKDVDLPPEMKRAMARQAEAERERRAKVINAEGELQASEKLAQAAAIIAASRRQSSYATSRPSTRSRPKTIRRRSFRSDRPVQGLHGTASRPRLLPGHWRRPPGVSVCRHPGTRGRPRFDGEGSRQSLRRGAHHQALRRAAGRRT